jgi:hypothetical protein
MTYMIVPEYKPLPLSVFLSDDVDFGDSTTFGRGIEIARIIIEIVV